MSRFSTTSCKQVRPPVTTAPGRETDASQKMRPIIGRTSGPTRRSTMGKWTAEEDELLRRAVEHYKGKSWKRIAECFKDRTDVQCLHRWQKVLNPELFKGPWSKEEDEKIIELVNKYGSKKWSTIAEALPGRIGKQCRERWHNHLNPNISKEPWTEEEELALIRAHQIYGNKWAELSKFLPGRTDNAIKNHWNSSVKKKLQSYLASGLLEQFQGLPYVGNPSSSSVGVQQCQVDMVEDDNSDCSQGSIAVICSQFDSGIENAARNLRTAEAGCRKGHNMEKYSLLEAETPGHEDYHFSSHNLPNIFVDDSQESLGFGTSEHSNCVNEIRDKHSILSRSSVGFNTSATMENMNLLISESDFFQNAFSDTRIPGFFFDGNVTEQSNNLDAGKNSVICQSDSQNSANTRIFAMESCDPLKDVEGGTLDFEAITSSRDDFIYVDSPDIDVDEKDDPMKIDEAKNNPKLVPVNIFSAVVSDSMRKFSSNDENAKQISKSDEAMVTSKLAPADLFGSVNSDSMQLPPSMDENGATAYKDRRGSGSLCYEPPCFPSLDIPSLNFDPIASGGDIQQAYSPLGIRQLLMRPMNLSSPCSLWDSPSHKSTPEAILKNASKSFICTPTIMKKRLRDFLSPVEETKGDKKLGKDKNMKKFSLTSPFSSLESILDENGALAMSISSIEEMLDCVVDQKVNTAESMHDKANTGHAFEENKENIAKESTLNIDPKAKPTGLLVEHNSDDQLVFSPDTDEHQTTRALSMAILSPKGQYVIRLDTKSYQGDNIESSSLKNEKYILPATSSECAPSLETSGNYGNDADIQSFSIFDETPDRKRGIESPSPWKSPWFLSTFLPPRADADMTLEQDLGYFLSPGMRCYDAIGLMRHLSEDTAATYANALDVLTNDDPEMPSKTFCSGNKNLSDPDNCFLHNNQENMPPGFLTEQRVLDFSGCGTPGKGTDNKKFPENTSAKSFSSPKSHLMRNCR
ncbi:transcription factor MYB3R-1 isoform X1 [Quercus suber]|uniref:transcription factor MYB3R-1 isoform X1 n=1 Tax=Quercus suber TaxID=58331 RepID=UPI000CE19B30|nr:transcription factor MYB3R-1-like isoform X1 [Quercus suber]POE74498.1 transcription factor myb3r-4 [Quercus suber]